MRVLVCDDDPVLGQFLEGCFAADGWDIDLVESGEDCLAALASGPTPDVIVLDQVMPGLQGTEVAGRLRDDGFTRPIVLCSANLAAAKDADVSRLGLLTVNKIDVPAVVRVAHAAAVDHQRTASPPAERRRQVWPD